MPHSNQLRTDANKLRAKADAHQKASQKAYGRSSTSALTHQDERAQQEAAYALNEKQQADDIEIQALKYEKLATDFEAKAAIIAAARSKLEADMKYRMDQLDAKEKDLIDGMPKVI